MCNIAQTKHAGQTRILDDFGYFGCNGTDGRLQDADTAP